MMKNLDNMHDFSRQVNLYLDNELSQDDQHLFLNQLKNNNQIQVLDNERSFRDFVKSNVYKSHVSPALIQNIKNKIRLG